MCCRKAAAFQSFPPGADHALDHPAALAVHSVGRHRCRVEVARDALQVRPRFAVSMPAVAAAPTIGKSMCNNHPTPVGRGGPM